MILTKLAQGIVINLFLLLGFVALLSMVRYWKTTQKRFSTVWIDGILFSAMALVAMMVPAVTGPGVMFDCRSGVIGAAALLGGPWCALISIPLPLLYRFHIGGAGMIPGIFEILMPALLGSIYYMVRGMNLRQITVRDAIIYSIVVGIFANGLVIASIFLFMPSTELGIGIGFIMIMFLYGPVSMALFSILLVLSNQNFINSEVHSSILRTAMDGYWLSDNNGRLHEVNETYSHMSGYNEPELLAGRIVDFEASMSEQEINDRQNEIIKENGKRFESCHRRKDGSTFDIEESVQYLPVAGGRFVTFIRDITERKRAEEALQESEKKYKLLIETTNTGYVILNDKGRVLDANSEYIRLTGNSSLEDISGRSVTEWTAPYDLARNAAEVQKCLKTGFVRNLEIDYISPSGKTVPIEIHASVIPGGKTPQIITVCRDITERRQAVEEKGRLSAQLIQAQKLEWVGRLAGGVAHDFNNMLGAIIGWADISRMDLPPDNPHYAAFGHILDAARRSADLTQQLLAFARKQHATPRIIDLNETVNSMLNILRRLIGEDIQLLWKPGGDIDSVFIDPVQVDQILANLCVNARDAIGNNIGNVIIKTCMVDLDNDFCNLHPSIIPGRYVMLEVNDDGCGMKKEILENIFEPFFTTKGVGKGTGLGLSTVYGIVNQNHGIIDVDSSPGKGSIFRIYLPGNTDQSAASKEPIMDETERGSETILLVEDEEYMLRAVQFMLTKLGYNVISANRPGIALQLAEEHGSKIGLLITDVVMPEQNGFDLAQAIRLLQPDLKCLYISGHTSDIIAQHGLMKEGISFLQKPFLLNDLAIKVREMLD